MAKSKYVSQADLPKLYMEKRTPDGQLDFSQPQPPFSECSENQITRYYFANAPQTEENAHAASLETIYGWYKAQGFTVRAKTW